ncbi:chorismate mutase [Helicobacter monodelphidis]|uniref:chorismate mutase n=1 Tax=Helicobacter sp. 15-1451 TaxID=2004995 RepID=UPI000DCD7A92|nr:chorismate mutase [Helicobacter sp. 15-1451]RAX56757.1 chorismate mutase [Helicobacter sp. 15-1451]
MIQQLRQEIDKIDNQILTLLSQRMEVVKQIGEEKRSTQTAIYRPDREREILERLFNLNAMHSNSLLNKEAIEAIYMEIFAVSRNLELPERIAYLGPLGSYTHQAAESRFGAMSHYLSMNHIGAVFKSVETKCAKYGVVPIENNKNGAVGETLDALANTSLKIVAEVILPIHHSFATLAESLHSIKRIYSKDIAFGQCLTFLNEYNLAEVERIPVDSTAKAAQLAKNDPESGAICSHIAANLHALPVLFEHIEDISNNKTRFVIISDFKNQPSDADKTSLAVDLANTDKPGVLACFLEDIRKLGINMTKIESRPKTGGKDFEFHFFIDFDGHIDNPHIQSFMQLHQDKVKWLGSYVKATGIPLVL